MSGRASLPPPLIVYPGDENDVVKRGSIDVSVGEVGR